MELKIDGNGVRTLVLEPYEITKCGLCSSEGQMYFCKEKGRLYCKECAMKTMDNHLKMFCDNNGQHEHIMIDNIIKKEVDDEEKTG
jgi:hypothetical protein